MPGQALLVAAIPAAEEGEHRRGQGLSPRRSSFGRTPGQDTRAHRGDLEAVRSSAEAVLNEPCLLSRNERDCWKLLDDCTTVCILPVTVFVRFRRLPKSCLFPLLYSSLPSSFVAPW